MKKRFVQSVSLVIFFLLASSYVSGQTKTSLEGKIFSIRLKIEGKERLGMKWDADEITFQNEKLYSKVMTEKEKFDPFDCTLTPDSSGKDIIHFKASGRNHAVSEIEWEGTVTGSAIKGTALWTNANGPQTQTFEGKFIGNRLTK